MTNAPYILQYDYKVISVDGNGELYELNRVLSEGWEVFNVTPQHGRGDSTLTCPVFFTLRKLR